VYTPPKTSGSLYETYLKLARSSDHSILKKVFDYTNAFVIGGVVCGLGAVIYYGLGYRVQNGVIERNSGWPQYIKDRISATYGYFGSSLFITLCSAVSVASSPTLIRLKMKVNPTLVLFGAFSSIISCGSLVRSFPYMEDHLDKKHLAWVAYAGLLGAFVAPMILISGPLMIKAAWYTAGVVSAMSLLNEKPPKNDDFIIKAKPLLASLLAIFFSSVGAMVMPKTTRLGLMLYRFTIYGGFLIFGTFVFYDTHRIVIKAERADDDFDPLNESLSIYINTLNILMRIAILIGNRAKRLPVN